MMRYYKIDIKRRYPDIERISSSADGKNIVNVEDYFWRMNKGEIVDDAPVFDYFSLKSYDKEIYWEWLLTDSFDFIGEGSQIPGWLVSKKIKKLFEQYKIAEPYNFYESKLLYKQEKLDYYIFHFSGDNFLVPLIDYIDFKIENMKDLISHTKRILKESVYDVINIPIKRLVLNSSLDFFPMQSCLGDNIVSARLKRAIEENGITGFEFAELGYEVVVK